MLDYVESLGPNGIGLRVEFAPQGDRMAHAIKLVGGSFTKVGRLWLRSVEGGPAEAWPASPPLQSVHLEERAAGQRIALLVGLAGKSHWSLSVEPLVGEGAIRFEAACRANAEPAWLGSQYEELEQLAVLESSNAVLREGRFVRVEAAAAAAPVKLPRTVCWSYVCRASAIEPSRCR